MPYLQACTGARVGPTEEGGVIEQSLSVDWLERQRQTFVTELRRHVDHLHRQVAAWEPAPCPKR